MRRKKKKVKRRRKRKKMKRMKKTAHQKRMNLNPKNQRWRRLFRLEGKLQWKKNQQQLNRPTLRYSNTFTLHSHLIHTYTV